MNAEAHHEKAKAALSSVLWSALLTGLKIWAGVSTGSLGILSEALHSGLDFVAAALTFYAVKIAAIPADDSHPYGHEKVENLSALGETLLLLITCLWIFWEAIDRLFFTHAPIELSFWAFAVVAISLVVDVNRAAMLRHMAKKHKSQALEADALHFTTDIWSSAVVMAGLICVAISSFVPQGTLLHSLLLKADAAAAMGVALIVLGVAYGISKRAIHALMDGGSKELTDKARKAVQERYTHNAILSLKVKDSGARVSVAIDVAAPRDLHVDDAHALSEGIEACIQEVIEDAEVTVRIEPSDMEEDSTPEIKLHHIALKYHIRAHGVTPVETSEGKMIFLDLEMPPEWTMRQADAVRRVFERDLKEALGVQRVVSHLEPDQRLMYHTKQCPQMSEAELVLEARVLCEAGLGLLVDEVRCEKIADVSVLFVSIYIEETMNLVQAHLLTDKIKDHLQHSLPALGKIVIEMMPQNNVAEHH